MQSLSRKIALVTGANKGIGFEVARQLGQAGEQVLLGARNPTLGKAAVARLKDDGIDVRFIDLDVSNPASIQAAAAVIEAEYGRLDVLVNNAGINDPADGPPSKTSLDAVRRVFDVNVFGVLAVTQAMLPLLRKSASARIVNVSSTLGSLSLSSDPGWEFAKVRITGYNTSKAALNMLTVLLAAELRDTNIKVNAACPGYTATDLNGNSGYQTVSQGAVAPVRLAMLPDDGPTGGYFSADAQEPW
jgi:NAD(P)-dependent dehydrogenase (short-subunit alcohol dehydrogenase family)